MTPVRTPEGKWVVYRVSDGQSLELWPIDARRTIENGECSLVDPEPDRFSAIKDAPIREAIANGAPILLIAPDAVDPVPHVAQAKALVEAKSPTGAPLVIGAVVEVTPGASPAPVVPPPVKTPKAKPQKPNA